MVWPRGAIVLGSLLIACTKHVPTLEDTLPERLPPFVASALTRGDGWVRRSYASEGVEISVTVARAPSSDQGYAQWAQMSATYPQATLALPADRANGFFSCDGEGAKAACDLHIQLRAGYHVEILGGGKASREQLQELANRLLGLDAFGPG